MESLKRQEELFNFFEAGRGVWFDQARELAADHDEVVVSGKHEFVVLDLDGGDGAFGREEFDFGNFQ